ncbi:hypothetical protein GS429_06815 [Natronorubrum sp. JWXQ-INN-674]|uniref:Uncharacterized protein n=1 Tax=Natronorubrum halalkaliphilum TaxID=2691917 RepID=A0A6B0VJR1_9EURY|nr:hypothetical protein [Natronorubrum halalkaliphilum]MXV61780.1 hypothetical protein [Natronorubrum halalkaliphilum]
MYEETFGTDWDAVDGREEAVQRAYALGVATRLDEHHPGELDRLAEQTDSTYDRSFVKLAYQKGQNQAGQIALQVDEDEAVWEELVEEKTTIELVERSDGTETDGEQDEEEETDTIPGAIRGFDIDTLPDDSTEAMKRPAFLERHRADDSNADDNAEPTLFGDGRTVFGRSMDSVRVDRSGTGGEQRDDNDGNGTDTSETEGEDRADADRDTGESGRSTPSESGGERPSESGGERGKSERSPGTDGDGDE